MSIAGPSLSLPLNTWERLIWSGAPEPAYFTRRSTPEFFMAIPFTAFALFWTGMATAGIVGTITLSDPLSFVSLLFPAFGLPFVSIGAWMLSSPIREFRRLKKTGYAITSERAIIKDSKGNVRSFPSDDLQILEIRETKSGLGYIVLGQELRYGGKGRTHAEEIGFLRIRDVRKVEGLLRSLIRSEME